MLDRPSATLRGRTSAAQVGAFTGLALLALSCIPRAPHSDFDITGPRGLALYALTSPCNWDRSTIIQSWAWPFVQNELVYQASLASSAGATVSTFGSPGGSSRYGAVLSSNGKIYAVPNSAGNVLEVDPHANGTFCSAVLQSGYFNKGF